MNAKTAKLLKRYAAKTSQDYRSVKREWNAMNLGSRARRRAEIKRDLGES